MSVNCTVTDPEGVADGGPAWTFGDGASAEGVTVTHRYAARGEYAIAVCVSPPGCPSLRCAAGAFFAYTAELPKTGESEACGCQGSAALMLLGLGAGLVRRGRGRRRPNLAPPGGADGAQRRQSTRKS